MKRWAAIGWGIAACLGATVGALGQGPTGSTESARRVLFIGNSLTAANELPRLVEALARASGGPPFACSAVTVGGFSLEDHWKKGEARRVIQQGGWDVVVLQQGPSALPESRVLLIEYARRFAAVARSVGAETALYMVWPSRARSFDFDGTSESYAAAAGAVDGTLLPVGDAWTAAWRLDPDLALYGPDQFHPNPLGSYLAALVIFTRLSGRTPVGLPPRLDDSPSTGKPLLDVEPAAAAAVQRAAAEVMARDRP